MWLRMLLSAMGLALGQHTSAEEGCSLSVWNSSTGPLGMKPADSKNTLSTLNLSLSGDAPFSAEAVCTLTVPAGNYSFSLVASGLGVNAYAWIDGHLVGRYAQSGVNLIGHDPTTFVRDESMDDVLPIGPFPAGALSGGLDNNTGLYRKAVLVRVWYNPLNDSSTGGVLCKTGGCTEQGIQEHDVSVELLATQSAGRVHWVPLLPLVRPPSVLPSCVLPPCAWLLLPSP
jgi:hypothetical protein